MVVEIGADKVQFFDTGEYGMFGELGADMVQFSWVRGQPKKTP